MTQSTNRKSQNQWTQDLIDHVEPGAHWAGVEHQWWYNSINPSSLRLTRQGYDWIKKHTPIKFYSVTLQSKILPKQLLQLERLIKNPYIIRQLDKLELVGEEDVIMLQLHGGDLVTYLNNLENNND